MGGGLPGNSGCRRLLLFYKTNHSQHLILYFLTSYLKIDTIGFLKLKGLTTVKAQTSTSLHLHWSLQPPSKAHTSTNLHLHWPATQPHPNQYTYITSQNNQNTPSHHTTIIPLRPQTKKKKKIFSTRSPSQASWHRQRVKYTRICSFSSNGQKKIFPLSDLISDTDISPVPSYPPTNFANGQKTRSRDRPSRMPLTGNLPVGELTSQIAPNGFLHPFPDTQIPRYL